MTWCVAAPMVFSQGTWGKTEIIRSTQHICWLVVSNIFLFSPRKLGKIPILTHIFQMDWNQPPTSLPFLECGNPSSRWYLFRVLENQVPSYIPPGVFPLSSGCQDPVGSEILGPERWPMQPGVTCWWVGFPGGERWSATCGHFWRIFLFQAVRVITCENLTYPHEKRWLEDETSFSNWSRFRVDIFQGFFWRVSRCPSYSQVAPPLRSFLWANRWFKSESDRGASSDFLSWEDFEGEKLKVPCFLK